MPLLYGCETRSLTRREEYTLRVFENRMLKIFWPKRDKLILDLGRVHYQKHSSPNITQLIKSRRMRWAGQVAWMGGIRRCIQEFGGTCEKRTIWKTEAEGIILKWILKRQDGGKAWTWLIWLRIGISDRLL